MSIASGYLVGWTWRLSSVQSLLCPTLCDPMDCSRPGFPVHYQLPELAQTHVHWVIYAIQPSHPLLPLCSPALNLSWHQGLFQWVSSLHQVAKVLELHHQSFQWVFRVDFLCPKDSPLFFSSTTIWKRQFLGTLSLLYDPTLTSVYDYRKKYSIDCTNLCLQSDVSAF